MSTTTCKSKDAYAAAATMSGRLFFLDFAGVRVFSANADGSDLKTIVREGRKLASLGRDGSKPAVAPGRRRGRDSSLHGSPDGSAIWDDEDARKSPANAELKQTIIDGVMREAGGSSVDQLAQDENRVLIGLLKLRGLDSKTAASAPKSDQPKSATQ